jgi:hypothetical protein
MKTGIMTEDILHNYNHSFHHGIHDIPERKYLLHSSSGVVSANQFKFSNDIHVGDFVRILKEKKKFQKGYVDKYSKDICKVIKGNGYTFSLQQANGEKLERKYKYYELLKVSHLEKYEVLQTNGEKPLSNKQKRNKREIEELLEHTVQPLNKKRKIIPRNVFS